MSTASLPDIVFMLLFFFMVTTVMQDEQPKVSVQKPAAKEIDKIEHRDLTASIFVGKNEHHATLIQMDDRFVSLQEIGQLVAEKRAALPEPLQPKFITVIKADKRTHMGVITDIKQELRKVNALKIQYAAVALSELKQ